MSEIRRWLEQRGFAEYAVLFEEHEIEISILTELSDADLKELGLPLGARRKLLKTIREYRNSSAAEPPVAIGAGRPERRQITVLMCDMVGSTRRSQQLDPEDYREILFGYQELCSATIHRYGGFIARFFGDGILVYFGYPEAHEDDIERAVLTGLELTRRMGELSAKYNLPSENPIEVRVGIATGPVVVGDIIGAGASQASTATGDTPNLAKHLQAIAKPNTVVAGETTHRLLGGIFGYEDLGRHKLKGIAIPQHAWRVTGELPNVSRFDAIRTAGLAPLLGRDEEIQTLLRLWRLARTGRGQVAFISGEPGIGKSRITRAVTQALAEEHCTFLRYQCSPQHTQSSLYPVISQLTAAAGITHSDSDDEKLNKLEAFVRQTTGDVRADAHVLATLLSIPATFRYGDLQIPPQQLKNQTLALLVKQLTTLASKNPVVVIVEDVHWADATTCELLDTALPRLTEQPVLIMITFRPEQGYRGSEEIEPTLINLNRLPSSTSSYLVKSIAHGKTLPQQTVEQIVDKSDGVPLFVEEFTKTILTSDRVHEVQGDYDVVGSPPPLDIPETLQGSLMARLDRLGAVKRVVQLAAVVGREFSHELIEALGSSREIETDIDSALAQLVAAGMILRRGEPPRATYTFKHALIQDIAYGSLLRRERQELHARIVETLEREFSHLLDTQPELGARHCSEAGLTLEAVAYWRNAGNRAARRFANTEALSHFNDALQAIDSLPTTRDTERMKLNLLVELITPAMALKGFASVEMARIYQQAIHLCDSLNEETPQIFPVLFIRWLSLVTSARLREALETAETFHALAERQSAFIPMALATRCSASVLYLCGEPARACAGYEKALQVLDDEVSNELGFAYGIDSLVGARSQYALPLASTGRLDEAWACSRAALDRAELLGEPQTIAYANVLAGLLHSVMRDAAPVSGFAETIEIAVEKYPMALLSAGALTTRACAELLDGRFESACRLLETAISERESLNSRWLLPTYFCFLAESCLAIGDLDRGLAAVALGLEEIERDGASWYHSELLRTRGVLLQARNENDDSIEQCFEQARSLAARQGATLFELRACVALGRFWRSRGCSAKAGELIEPFFDRIDSSRNSTDLQEAQSLLNELV